MSDAPPATPPSLPPRPAPPPIVYDLPPTESAAAQLDARVADTRVKFAARSARFGEPLPRLSTSHVLGARRAAVRSGFVSGFDPMSPEYAARRAARAARFGINPVEPEPPANLAARTARFGPLDDAPPLDIPSHPATLEPRRHAAPGELPRDAVLHVFGVDRLQTKNIMGYFREYGPAWCEWLNDSSCNVAFEDPFSMRRALRAVVAEAEGGGLPLTSDSVMKDDEADAADAAAVANGSLDERLVWRRARSVKRRGGDAVPIWVRVATEVDRRPEAPNPRSKWSRTVAEKRAGSRGEASRDRRRDSSVERPSHSAERRRGHSEERHGRTNLGVSLREQAIRKVRAKKVTRMDLDKALSSS